MTKPASKPMRTYLVCGIDDRGHEPIGTITATSMKDAERLAAERFHAWPSTHVHPAAPEQLTKIELVLRQKGTRQPVRRCKCGTEFTPQTRDHRVCSFGCAMRLTAIERKALTGSTAIPQ